MIIKRPDYLVRMDKELEELQEKIRKLEAFIYHDPEFKRLPPLDIAHLCMQLGHMRGYASTLHARIVDKNIELREE
ncbi:hypothetical protein ACLF2M_003397 [Vibrio vulnificus]